MKQLDVRITSLAKRRDPLADPDAQRRRLRALPLAREFEDALAPVGLWPLRPTGIDIVQVNVGKLCNQTCRHCHVDAGPDRTEVMTRETFAEVLALLDRMPEPEPEAPKALVDITGGAPELNPHFRWFVAEATARGHRVMDRCNLTVIETGPGADLPDFFAEHRVEVVCSLPHYRKLGTDAQRGDGVYEKSIRALRKLNERGYGMGDERGLEVTLVTNPVGAFFPGKQASLEAEWKRELLRRHGVHFDRLLTITNMPISRFLEWLESSGNLEAYLQRLVGAFNPVAAANVMCRNTLSIGWDGVLYDCDFNQMLEMPLLVEGRPQHVRDVDLDALGQRAIQTDRHCFGCTAGAGSSCGGATG